jgi:hypothetical protein
MTTWQKYVDEGIIDTAVSNVASGTKEIASKAKEKAKKVGGAIKSRVKKTIKSVGDYNRMAKDRLAKKKK